MRLRTTFRRFTVAVIVPLVMLSSWASAQDDNKAAPGEVPAELVKGGVPKTASALPLSLESTELTLVDGRKVQGQLACELEDRLVLYSPSGGTLASFRKEFVASYTNGGQKVKLSEPRALTPEELNIKLNWKGWPDAAPGQGPKPAYTTQKWSAPKRLLVWNTLKQQSKTGKILVSGQNSVACVFGDGDDATNWLVFGAPLEAGKWDLETDVLLPGVDEANYYVINAPSRDMRHCVAENHAKIGFHGMRVQGNIWWHERGHAGVNSVRTCEFVGPYHTFIKNDRPTLFNLGKGDFKPGSRTFNVDDKEMVDLTYDNRSYRICQYIFIRKDKLASVEFLGSFITGDKFWTYTGITIIGPDSSVHADTRSGDHVYKDGTLQLMSGAHWHKIQNKMYGADFEINGTVEFGTKERPLTKDVVIEVSWKDYTMLNHKEINKKADWEACGFAVFKTGKARMYSADPKTARVVFRYLDRDNGAAWSTTGRRNNASDPSYRDLPRRIDVLFLGDVQLDGVLFENLHKGGVRLGDLKMKDALKNVVFGESCQSTKPEENFALHQKDVAPPGWAEDPVVKAAAARKAAGTTPAEDQ